MAGEAAFPAFCGCYGFLLPVYLTFEPGSHYCTPKHHTTQAARSHGTISAVAWPGRSLAIHERQNGRRVSLCVENNLHELVGAWVPSWMPRSPRAAPSGSIWRRGTGLIEGLQLQRRVKDRVPIGHQVRVRRLRGTWGPAPPAEARG